MTTENVLQAGITAFKAGDKNKAQDLLQQAVRHNPHNQAAWLWLAAAVPDVDKRRCCLERVRAINPDNEHGQRALKGLSALPPVPGHGGNGAPAAAPAPASATPEPVRDDSPDNSYAAAAVMAPPEAVPASPAYNAPAAAPPAQDEPANGSPFAVPPEPTLNTSTTPITIPPLPEAPPEPAPAKGRRHMQREKRVMSLRDMMNLMGLSLLFGCIGIGMIILSGAASQGADAAAAAPVVSGASLDRMASGQQVIIEGHISSRNDQRQGTFVAYIEEKEERRRVRDSDGDYRWKTTWETEDTFRQPLNIDTSEGTARISNSSYRLSSPRHTKTQHDHRWRGFQVGDRVMALGITRNASLDASVLHGGNKDSYVSGQRLQATMLFWVGIVVVVGTVLSAGLYALRHG